MSNILQNKKYHFIYKTTCLVNEKFYYGMHSTSNLKDGYLGSGKRLRRAVTKYGPENFKIEILEFLPDRETLASREKEIITEEMLQDLMCMNLQPGGGGGWTEEQRKKGTARMLSVIWQDLEFRKRKSEKTSNLHKEGKLKTWKDTYDWTGKKQSKEHTQKIKESNKGNQKGEKNSQFGTIWINNGIENKKIKKEELKYYLSLNWIRGHINFFKEKLVYVNKDGLNKCIKESELASYILLDWKKGRHKLVL
jgi:hypothetical protein